ncbi:10260_t:CDS:2 [Funneliformis caledonium]|uniref:10260_t:CDS:1 n=1 Tax=Funneliformis caledonium TaxID=1117310 RepID=A0A9N9B1U7_9GLOM|nr:10260_t:CDS:2 [Funneliformis caledonium]
MTIKLSSFLFLFILSSSSSSSSSLLYFRYSYPLFLCDLYHFQPRSISSLLLFPINMDDDQDNEINMIGQYNEVQPIQTNEINVGDNFISWEDAEIKLNQYARLLGFSLRRKRVECDNNGIFKHSLISRAPFGRRNLVKKFHRM